jgi:hypothetical protein
MLVLDADVVGAAAAVDGVVFAVGHIAAYAGIAVAVFLLTHRKASFTMLCR